MTHRTDGQAGFSTGLTIAAVLVVLAIAGVGFMVFKKSDTKTATAPTDSTSSKDQANLSTQQNQNPAPSDPTEGGKYLVITEWGARVALSSDLKGAVTYSL